MGFKMTNPLDRFGPESDVVFGAQICAALPLDARAEIVTRHVDRFAHGPLDVPLVTCAQVKMGDLVHEVVTQTWWLDTTHTHTMTLCALRGEWPNIVKCAAPWSDPTTPAPWAD